ncbi:MAG: NTP transferase domain-containing protein [Armatimonadetes bacterium]|nr:NTP transferase domain-containing protein [Armatimonadota bacterium]
MAQPKPTLLVLAAGMGSRYGGLKQIDPVGPSGETLLDYSVYDALRSGFGRVVFVIRHSIEADFREAVGSRFESKLDVDYAFQELNQLPPGFVLPEGRTKPWGTTHAILAAENQIHGQFAAINADDFYGRGAFQALAGHFASGSPDYAMVGFTLRNTLSEHGSVARGLCRVDESGYLTHIEEVTKIEREGLGGRYMDDAGKAHHLTGDEAVSMNFWGFDPTCFERFRKYFSDFLSASIGSEKSEFYIPSAIKSAIDEGSARVRVLRAESQWFGVTYREDKPSVVQGVQLLIAGGAYPERLWE